MASASAPPPVLPKAAAPLPKAAAALPTASKKKGRVHGKWSKNGKKQQKLPGYTNNLTPEQTAALDKMRENCKSLTCWELQNKTDFTMDDTLFLRFLRGPGKWDVEVATKAITEHLAWRDIWRPTTLTLADLPNAFDSGDLRFWAPAKGGKIVMHIDVEKFDAEDLDGVEEFTKQTIYYFERAKRIIDWGVETGLLIFDLGGFGTKHMSVLSMKMIAQLCSIAQHQFPEVLHTIYLLNVPFIFRAAWRAIKGWVDPVTVAKVQMNAPLTALQEHIPIHLIPKRYGGEMEGEYPKEKFLQVEELKLKPQPVPVAADDK